MSKAIRGTEPDGVYPRCVWCGGENYAPNVIGYSKGISGCHQCGKLLPPEYVKLLQPQTPTNEEGN